MTTSEGIRDAWKDNIWDNATIVAITDKAFSFDATIPAAQVASSEITRLMYGQEINFFQYHVTRSVPRYLIGGSAEYQFQVRVEYFREVNTNGTNRNECADALETLMSEVLSDLGDTWDSTVDFWRPQETPYEISTVTLDGKQVWKGTTTFTGFKTSTLQ